MTKKKPQANKKPVAVKGANRKVVMEVKSFPWRRLSSLVLGCGILAGLVWGGGQLFIALDRPFEELSISGEFEHLDASRIERLVQARVDEGLLAADLTEIQQLLLSEPWIEQVTVRRKWPNLLQVDLVERAPVVRWNQDALLTENGEVFRPQHNLERYQLPRLVGDESSRVEMLDKFHWLSDQLNAEKLTVSELTKQARGAWQFKLAEGFRVELGKGELVAKVKRFKGIYAALLHERVDEIEKVDLRYTHGAAVEWKIELEQREIDSRQSSISYLQKDAEVKQLLNGSKV